MNHDFVLGRDAGPYGRIARALVGVWLILAGAGIARRGGFGTLDAVTLAGYTVGAVLLYTAVTYLLGERLLTRLNPWTGTALLLLPVVTLTALSVILPIPATLLAATYLYVGLSVLLIGVVGYGGCEIVGLPVVLLRRRYTVYCAFNAIDAAERPLTHGRHGPAERAAALLALLGGLYYFLLQPLLDLLDVHLPLSSRWGAVLLLPAIGVLAWHAWQEHRVDGWAGAARDRGVGAVALAANAVGIAAFGSVFFVYVALTAVVFLTGVVQGLRQAAGTHATRRRLSSEAAR